VYMELVSFPFSISLSRPLLAQVASPSLAPPFHSRFNRPRRRLKMPNLGPLVFAGETPLSSPYEAAAVSEPGSFTFPRLPLGVLMTSREGSGPKKAGKTFPKILEVPHLFFRSSPIAYSPFFFRGLVPFSRESVRPPFHRHFSPMRQPLPR